MTAPGPSVITDEAAWSAAAAAVLRRSGRLSPDAPDGDAWDRLARTTVEGLTVPPLGTASRTTDLAPTGIPGEPPYTRGSRIPTGRRWDVRTLVTDPDPAAANAAILADLENGATSVWLTVGHHGTAVDDLPAALDGVHPEMAPIALGPTGGVTDLAAAQAFRAWCGSRAVTPDPDGTLGADPIGRAAGTGAEVDLSEISEIATIATDLGVAALVVDGTAAHRAGAGDAGEIGYVLAAGAAYLRALTAGGRGVDEACGLLGTRLAVTADQFCSIAKLRAARLTWNRLTELCGAPAGARAQRQHAVTAPAIISRYDPWVNLLRTTVSGFAAGVGGADAITVLPFDAALGIPDALGRRLARNISAILTEESHVVQAADPAGGSYAVELLTSGLAQAAWAEFQRIEASGGIAAALADGSWRARAGATAAERRRRVATRRQPITGVSEFPLAAEVLPTRAGTPLTDGVDRWAAPFEALRDEPAADPVVLVRVGGHAEASARMAFVENLLAAGGIDVVLQVGPGDGVHDAPTVRGGLRGRTAIVVGTDEAYASDGQEAISRARSEGARRVFVAGRPPEQVRDLVDGHVAAGDDVLAFLRRLRLPAGASA